MQDKPEDGIIITPTNQGVKVRTEEGWRPRKETKREKVWVEIYSPLGHRFHSQRTNENNLDADIKMFKHYYGDEQCHTILITNHKNEILRRY